jgi:hypothetical protein
VVEIRAISRGQDGAAIKEDGHLSAMLAVARPRAG